MTTITAIADEAFDAANSAITDAIHNATITYETAYDYSYDPHQGDYVFTTTSITGRALFDTEKPVNDLFPDYVVGAKEILVLLEGFTTECKEGWKLTVNSIDYTIKKVQTVAGSVSLMYAVVVKQ